MTTRTFLEKWLSYGSATMSRAVTKSALKLLWCISDHANVEGIAWPSTRTLARRSGIDHRNIGRHLTQLVDAGYVSVVSHGTWHGDSNRYRLTYRGVEDMRNRRSEVADEEAGGPPDVATSVIRGDDTPTVATGDNTLSSSVTEAIVTGDEKLSSRTTTKPPTELAHNASEVVVGGQLRSGAGGAVLAPARDSEGVTDRGSFAGFIAAFPKKINVAEARCAFEGAVAGGVAPEILQRQAAAYAALCTAQAIQHQYIQAPKNWLVKQRWLDDFSVSPAREKPGASTHEGKKRPAPSATPEKLDRPEPVNVPDGQDPTLEQNLAVAKSARAAEVSAENDRSYQSPESEAARVITREGFESLRHQLDVVYPGAPLREQLRSLHRSVFENDHHGMKIIIGFLSIEEAYDSIDKVLAEVGRNEWGDADGCGSDAEDSEVSIWFGPFYDCEYGLFLIKHAEALAARAARGELQVPSVAKKVVDHTVVARAQARSALHVKGSIERFARLKRELDFFDPASSHYAKLRLILHLALQNSRDEASASTSHYKDVALAVDDVDEVLAAAERGEWGDADCKDEHGQLALAGIWFGARKGSWAEFLIDKVASYADRWCYDHRVKA